MALSYTETYDLTKDPVFRGRVAVASTHYAVFITDEAASTPAHSTRYKWAQNTLANVEGAVAMVITTVCNDAAVQTDGAAITDAALQSTVETAVNKLL